MVGVDLYGPLAILNRVVELSQIPELVAEHGLHDGSIRSQRLGSPAITDCRSRITLAEQVPQLEIHPEIVGMLELHSLQEPWRIATDATPACSECDHQGDRLFLDAGHLCQLGKTLHPLPSVGIADAI